jgi:hypothetical protein
VVHGGHGLRRPELSHDGAERRRGDRLTAAGPRERARERGDFQTPLELARAALAVAARAGGARLTGDTRASGGRFAPATVIEPTCGDGAFLAAAAEAFPRAQVEGLDIDEAHVATARALAPRGRVRVRVADFFRVDWERELARAKEPILVAGNPPWVTSAAVGALGGTNLPEKRNVKRLAGLDARTGKANFDVAEWMLLRLVEALRGRDAMFAVLCKALVARRVVEHAEGIAPGGLWRIDAARHFGAAASAVLFVFRTDRSLTLAAGKPDNARERPSPSRERQRAAMLPSRERQRAVASWPVYASLDAERPESVMRVVGGALVSDARKHARTEHLAGACDPEWRSGIKHDCARVMELSAAAGGAGGWRNGLGERVRVEDDVVFPLLKGGDVARGAAPTRALLVPQRALDDDTLARRAPLAARYLARHEDALAARKSSIYRGRGPHAIFGVGPYAFAPWKVAVSGLHKDCAFRLVGPHGGRPVMLDDTCYFLPFAAEADARAAHRALSSAAARDFVEARVFWDDKRPVSKTVLQRLDLRALMRLSGGGGSAQ